MATDFGPGNGTASLFLGQTAGVEVHVGNPPSIAGSGVNPLPPSSAPYIDPFGVGTNVNGNQVTVTNKTVTFAGAPGATVLLVNPA